MSPVVERVTHSVGHSLRPLLELLPVAGIARAVTLRHAICTHRTPFVVVAIEPYLGKRTETVVGGNHRRAEVTMVVDDWHLCRVVVV